MAAPLSIFDPKAYHIISYGTFLGATFFQTFIAGPVGFKTLPRPLFARLQQTTTPVFFTLQTALSLAILFSYPGERQIALGSEELSINSGITGLAQANVYHVVLPLASILVTSVVNMLVTGPLTTKTMKQRQHQETRDGKKSHEPGPHSDEMQRLNKQFGILHSVSSLLDLVGFLAATYYGFVLGARL